MELVFTVSSFFTSYVILSYFLWKELKNDYLNGQIFTFSFWYVALIFLTADITRILLPGAFWFYGALVASVLGFVFLTKKYGIKPHESIDSLIKGTLGFSMIVISLYYLILDRNPRNLFLVAVIFILVLIHNYVKSNYKKFTWYKSGRIGLAGSISISVFFLTRFVISIFSTGMLSFSEGIYDALTSLCILFASLYNIYRLSGGK